MFVFLLLLLLFIHGIMYVYDCGVCFFTVSISNFDLYRSYILTLCSVFFRIDW